MSLRSLQRLGRTVFPVVMRSVAAEGGAAACPVALTPSSTRMVFARELRTSTVCFSLADQLKQELDYETSQGEVDDGPLVPPNGFKLEEKSLNTVMRLTKSFGKEEVVIELNTIDQNDGDMELDEDAAEEVPAYPISFTVGCTKGDQTLKFMCSYLEGDTEPPSIEHVAIEPKGGYPEADLGSVYEGPSFQELDEKLQAEFGEYLTSRGITEDMGQYLCRLNYDKEQREYVAWLQRVHTFTKDA